MMTTTQVALAAMTSKVKGLEIPDLSFYLFLFLSFSFSFSVFSLFFVFVFYYFLLCASYGPMLITISATSVRPSL